MGASHFCKKYFLFECERPRSRIVQYASGDARTINTKLNPIAYLCGTMTSKKASSRA